MPDGKPSNIPSTLSSIPPWPGKKLPVSFILAFLFVNTIDMEMLNVFLMKLTFAGSQFDTFWGLVNAGAIISFVPILLFYIFLQQYFVRGVTGSAVKE